MPGEQFCMPRTILCARGQGAFEAPKTMALACEAVMIWHWSGDETPDCYYRKLATMGVDQDIRGLPFERSRGQVSDTIRSHRIVAISGATGSGKSRQNEQSYEKSPCGFQ